MRSFLDRTGVQPAYLAALGLAAAAILGPFLLVVSDFFTLFEVRSVTAKIASVSGGRNHLYAMVIVGLVAAPMAYGAIRGGSRPAMIALAALGVLAALIALAFDLPDATGSSTLNKSFAYASAEALPKLGFYLETLGAALTIIAGGGALMLTGAGAAPAPRAEAAAPAHGQAEPSGSESGEERQRTERQRDERQRAEAAAARAAARAQRLSGQPDPGSAPSPSPSQGPEPAPGAPAGPGPPDPPAPRTARSGGLAARIAGQLANRRRRER